MDKFSRRSFLKTTTTASTGLLFAPSLLSFSVNSKLNIAVIGVGNRGAYNLRAAAKNDTIVALCDVDDRMMAKATANFPKAKTFRDFRVMFGKMANEIDAVVISTPDHTHFAATMAAMELGKHVYVEKPLAHNIWQLRTLKKAAMHYGIVSQMGNQGHTTHGIRLVKEWYDAGVIGEVKEVHAWRGVNVFKPNFYFSKPAHYPPLKETIPSELDWDLWLGGTTFKDYNAIYTPKSWRGFYDFGSGQLGDWACHTLDTPFWALNLGMPYKVKASIPKNAFNDHSFIPDASTVTFYFKKRGKAPAVKLVWHEGFNKPNITIRPEWGIDKLPKAGMIMIGNKNSIITGGRPNDARILVPYKEQQKILRNAPKQTIKRIGEEQPHQEWIDAIKNNSLPGSNFNYSADLTEFALIGVLAQRFGGKIKYDAKKMQITNRKKLNAYIKEPVRANWSYGENF